MHIQQQQLQPEEEISLDEGVSSEDIIDDLLADKSLNESASQNSASQRSGIFRQASAANLGNPRYFS